MSDDVVIKVEGLWKRYGLPLVPVARGLVNRLRKNRGSILDDGGPWALRDVSFEVKRGETLGIIGRNGVGKSTLLKILAGVTPPTHGRVETYGRVFPMIELNAGIHPELTGRENVRLLGAIMGLSRKEVEAKIPEIEEFTELREWFDRPVRKYSSGMLARLGFGVAMNVDADILLIDEVLAVGDIAFQRRCFERIEKLRNAKTTILFVSHSIRQIQRICSRVAMFEEGQLVIDGESQEVTQLYYEKSSDWSLALLKQKRDLEIDGSCVGTGEIIVTSVRVVGASNEPADFFYTGDKLVIEITLEAKEIVDTSHIGIAIFTTDFIRVCNFKYTLDKSTWPLNRQSILKCVLPNLPLLPGVYLVSVNVKEDNNRLIFRGEHVAEFVVKSSESSRQFDGLVYVQPIWEYEDIIQ